MAYQKKVVILNDINSREGTGIVKLTEDGSIVSADVSIHRNNDEKLTLLIKGDKGLFSYKVSNKCVLDLSGFSLSKGVDLLIINDEKKAILYGSTTTDKYRCFNLSDEYERLQNNAEKPKTLTVNDKKFDEPEPSAETDNNIEIPEVEPVEEDEFEVFSGGFEVNATSFDENTVLGADINYDGNNFYSAVKPQLDEMFTCYPVDTELTNAVPGGKWVRVNTEDDFYVVGVIYELDEAKYICYGIHGEFNKKPPEEIAGVCDWLPLNLDEPEAEGYWMIYQDCVTGKTIKR